MKALTPSIKLDLYMIHSRRISEASPFVGERQRPGWTATMPYTLPQLSNRHKGAPLYDISQKTLQNQTTYV